MPSYSQHAKEQLGMAYSTARSRLIKTILFNLLKKNKENICHRCNKEIVSVDDLSIDHIEEWLHKENSTELFFDNANIGFSHNECNSSAARCSHTVNAKTGYKGVYTRNDGKKRKKPFVVRIRKDNTNKVIGNFETEEETAKAYDKAAKEIFGDKAITNQMMGLIKGE